MSLLNRQPDRRRNDVRRSDASALPQCFLGWIEPAWCSWAEGSNPFILAEHFNFEIIHLNLLGKMGFPKGFNPFGRRRHYYSWTISKLICSSQTKKLDVSQIALQRAAGKKTQRGKSLCFHLPVIALQNEFAPGEYATENGKDCCAASRNSRTSFS